MSDEGTAMMREVLAAASGGPAVAVATVIRGPDGQRPGVGEKLLFRNDGSRAGSLGGGAIEEAVAGHCAAALTRLPRIQAESIYYRAGGEQLQRLDAGAGDFEVMIEVTEHPATLLIVGGGHVGHSLATIAAHVGFSVAVIDDREAFASVERFPMADRVICGDFEEELQAFPIDTSTYVVLVSRGHKQDELSLREVAPSDAAYVGMIGSKRRVGTVLRHLAEEGMAKEALGRVHTPIGLDLGAETPEEIAVSIMAELIIVRRGGSGAKMSEERRAKARE